MADLIGMSANGKWFTRYMRFVQTVPANNPNTPVQLRDLVGDGPAERLLAQVIISRAFAQTLKHAAYVGPATQCARNGMGWTLWRTRITLTGGVTAADTPRRYDRQSQQWKDGEPTFFTGRTANSIAPWKCPRPTSARPSYSPR